MIRDFVTSPKFLPSVLILLDVGSAARWAAERNAGQAIYWFSAATLTYAVTFMMGMR